MSSENDKNDDQQGGSLKRSLGMVKPHTTVVAIVSIAWALFQLALPRLVILDSTTVRAVHLAFAMTLVFLTIPAIRRKHSADAGDCRIRLSNYILAGVACLCVSYFVLDWTGILMRAANPLLRDTVIGIILIVLLLEASRRAIGPALPIIALVFTLYAFFGDHLPLVIAFRSVSLRRYLSQIALSTEGIFGIPLHVSANTVFLFVLFGSMLEKAGAGRFFNDLALSLLGRFKGGAADTRAVSQS